MKKHPSLLPIPQKVFEPLCEIRVKLKQKQFGIVMCTGGLSKNVFQDMVVLKKKR